MAQEEEIPLRAVELMKKMLIQASRTKKAAVTRYLVMNKNTLEKKETSKTEGRNLHSL